MNNAIQFMVNLSYFTCGSTYNINILDAQVWVWYYIAIHIMDYIYFGKHNLFNFYINIEFNVVKFV